MPTTLWFHFREPISESPSYSREPHRFNIKDVVTFEITAEAPILLSEMRRLAAACGDFLTLATHGYRRAVNISLIPASRLNDRIQLGTLIAVPFYKATSKVTTSHFLFSASDFAERFPEMISAWLKCRRELQDSRALYMWGVYGRGFIESKLIALTAAAEAFHRQFKTGQYRDQQDFDDNIFEPLRKAIPASASQSHRDSIAARLRFANEFSQRKRLQELFAEHDEVLRHLDPKPRELVDPIIDLRNEYTHFPAPSVENRHRDRDGSTTVVRYNWVLRLLLEACFLQRIGLTGEDIVRIVHRSEPYRQLAERFKR